MGKTLLQLSFTDSPINPKDRQDAKSSPESQESSLEKLTQEMQAYLNQAKQELLSPDPRVVAKVLEGNSKESHHA